VLLGGRGPFGPQRAGLLSPAVLVAKFRPIGLVRFIFNKNIRN